MHSFRQIPILFKIAFYMVPADAFSTFSFIRTNIFHIGDVNRMTCNTKRTKYSQKLSMVANIPTSNLTLDDMMLSDSVIADNVNVEDVKHIDDCDDNELEHLSTMDTMEIKNRLLDILPRMTGTPGEYNLVESYVNALEDRYSPVQTLGFLNLAMAGEWQLLFSTNIGSSSRTNFRLRELYQRIEPNDFNGTIVSQAVWNLAEDHEGVTPAPSFDAFGTFSIKCSYSINQGARIILELNDHVIELTKGSVVPKDVQKLLGYLYGAIPTELFDPNDHAMDTTYLDGDLRIVRMSGPKFEAVRDIFIRRGSIEINPT